MQIREEVRTIAQIVILSLDGKVTLGEGTMALYLAIRAIIKRKKDVEELGVILDFSNVVYIDSSGMGELFSSFTQMSVNGVSSVISNLPENISNLLETVKLHRVYDTFKTKDEAVEALKIKLTNAASAVKQQRVERVV